MSSISKIFTHIYTRRVNTHTHKEEMKSILSGVISKLNTVEGRIIEFEGRSVCGIDWKTKDKKNGGKQKRNIMDLRKIRTYFHTDVCAKMFITNLTDEFQTPKQHKCPSVDERLNKGPGPHSLQRKCQQPGNLLLGPENASVWLLSTRALTGSPTSFPCPLGTAGPPPPTQPAWRCDFPPAGPVPGGTDPSCSPAPEAAMTLLR